jgi:RHS repeat-associated protein
VCTYDAWGCTTSVTTFIWAGDQLLWERKNASGTYAATAGGEVSYFHAGGIDRPLVITKNGESIVPHQNWRGQFARGTYADGPNVGKRSDCVSFPASGCTPIQWPGERTTARHELKSAGEIHNWFGGLVDDMRDASGQMYRRNRYYDPQSGQFTQSDPIGLAGGMNAYGFAEGDPITFSDPYGLCIWLWLKRCRDKSSRVTYGDVTDLAYRGFSPIHQMDLLSVRDWAADMIAERQASWGTDERSAAKANAFRHIFGSCQLTRWNGKEDARQTLRAHERRLRNRDDAQEQDSREDSGNNEIGMTEGASTDSRNSHLTCENIADRAVNTGHYFGAGGMTYGSNN